MREMFQAKVPEAFEVLTRHLQSSDPRIAITAASAIPLALAARQFSHTLQDSVT